MIRDFTIQDYEAAFAVWQSSEHIGLSSADIQMQTEPNITSLAPIVSNPL